MSVSYIPDWVKLCLWGKAGGRCQYDGCNRQLFRDGYTQAEFNSAYIAHIVADKPDGPRGDPILSELLKRNIDNLMLLCDVHHRLVDKIDVAGHSVQLLQEYKRRHEARIELVTGIQDDQRSHVLLYGAKIGEHGSPLSFSKAASAMIPARRPAEPTAIELGWKPSPFEDSETAYWMMEREVLRRQFAERMKAKLDGGKIEHLSVFALAPIPLLIELGRLLSDLPAAEVFQLHREPADWKWREEPRSFAYELIPPVDSSRKTVALILGLSADVIPVRVEAVLGANVAVWTLKHAQPGNDFLHSAVQLQEFRRALREAFNRIKAEHGEDAELHLFPAVPVSAAVEIGRVWMPKADLQFAVYDQNRKTGGFTRVFDIP